MSTPAVVNTFTHDKQLLDAFVEALRHKFCALPRHSFVLEFGCVRRVRDSTGNWVDWDDVHRLFDAAVTDALLGELPSGVERFQKMMLNAEVALGEPVTVAPAENYTDVRVWPLARLRRDQEWHCDMAILSTQQAEPEAAEIHRKLAEDLFCEVKRRLGA